MTAEVPVAFVTNEAAQNANSNGISDTSERVQAKSTRLRARQ